MPTLATGTSINNATRVFGARSRGFTLIEVMVVVVIIGVITSMFIVKFSGSRRDTQLEKEAQRLDALFDYVREQAELQTRDYGFRVNARSYSFVVFDVIGNQWREADEDDALRERQFPEGIAPVVVVEGRNIVLDQKKQKVVTFNPDVVIFSNGDLSSFEVALQREGGGGRARIYSDEQTNIQLLLPGESAPPAAAQHTARLP